MPKVNLTASVYRVPRGKAEIAREAKWQKTAKLTTKKRLELQLPKPEEKAVEGSGGPNQPMAPRGDDAKSSGQGQATEVIGPKAPDSKKGQ
jgi:hypothetical protein